MVFSRAHATAQKYIALRNAKSEMSHTQIERKAGFRFDGLLSKTIKWVPTHFLRFVRQSVIIRFNRLTTRISQCRGWLSSSWVEYLV
jgi:hypothetical protein